MILFYWKDYKYKEILVLCEVKEGEWNRIDRNMKRWIGVYIEMEKMEINIW